MSNNVQQNILDVNEDNKIGCMDVLSVGGVVFTDVTLFVDGFNTVTDNQNL